MKTQLIFLMTTLIHQHSLTRPLSIKLTNQEPTHELT